MRALPEVRSVLIYGGQILGSGAEPRKATFVINFVNKIEREASQKDLQARIGAMLAATPDIRYWFVKDNGQRDLSLIVAGPDIDAINDAANQLASEMRSIPTIENPISTAELDRPELRIEPKRQLAADLGVSTEALSETIRVATLGDIDANLAKFNAGDRLVPIRVELDEAARGDVGRLEDLRVADRIGRRRAALRRRRLLDRPRPDRDQPLRPHAPRHHRGRPRRRRRARRRGRGDPRAADRQDSCRRASKSARPATSRS